MKRWILAVVAGLAWFGFGAPRAMAWLDTLRDGPRRQMSADDVRTRHPAGDLGPEAREALAEASELAAKERDWALVVGGLLTQAERKEGLARAASEPLLLANAGQTIEPEIPALVDALLARYGPATAVPPRVPLVDDWPMVDRRMRARVLVALIRGPGLDPERASIVLGVTLDLLETQARRTALEEKLAELVQ